MKISNELFFEQSEQLLQEGTPAEFTLRGDSMLPLLRDGRDCVVVAPLDERPIHVGDVLLFRFRGIHLLHRVIGKEEEVYILAGDGNYLQREVCHTEDIVGRLVAVHRPSGRIIDCQSRRWRIASHAWCLLPAIVRRIILAIRRRIVRR